ncbi:MAG: cell surface protein SprA, partial [Bacteroidales bacterium]
MTIGKKTKYYIFSAVIVLTLYSVVWAVPAPKGSSILYDRYFDSATTSESEKTTDVLTFPPDTGNKVDVPQPNTNPLDESGKDSPFTLQNPPGVGTTIEYDPETNTYNFQYMTGSTPYGPGANMDINEFIDYDLRKETANYWKEKGVGYKGGGNRRGGGGIIPQLKIGGDVFESIFGSNVIDIRPSGSAELIFGVIHRTDQNPNIPVKQRRRTNFNFDQNIQLNLLAKIGDKIEFNLNYNTEANFDFETEKIKLKYEGKEDDIIQLLEFGNVSLPLNSSLITGSQSLFGIKTQLKFGNLTVTAVASEQTSETKTITVTGGAQTNEFYFKADEYEENKHYFIGQYFRDHYNKYLETLPLVGSPIVITKIEVWRTTIGAATTENRNIVAFTDLGEAHPQFQGFQYVGGNMPDNGINNLTSVVDSSLIRDISTIYGNMRSLGLTSGIDYEKVESARLLSSSEYTFNSKLGFISLNSALGPDQVLAVAFQYTVIGDNKVYQVGEFSNEVSAPSCLRVKLLKSTTLDTKSTLWKLMMKNVYSLSAYQISPDKFRLNVLYKGDEAGIANGFFDEGAQKGIPLIRLMGLDRLNQQMDPFPDGIFDFIDGAATTGGTINAANGRVYFPKIEPFGKDLQEVLTDPVLAAKYAFDSLYTTTKTIAQQFTDKNKYYIEGSYKSSYGSEYSLNAMNVPEGSVKVTAGGIPLIENIDYTVNYSMGSISILNEGILNSGTPISITVEDNASYAAQKRRMFGANLDYQFSKNFNIGATILNLRERPITQKVNYGDEPINNVIWGMNFAYKSKVPFITKLVDFLPFHSTTAESNFSADGEFAHFIPGHSRAIGKVGITYI